jgi:hypothetical protein
VEASQQTGIGGLWPVPQGAEVARFVSDLLARYLSNIFITYKHSQDINQKIDPRSNNYVSIVGPENSVSSQNPPQELLQPRWPMQTKPR